MILKINRPLFDVHYYHSVKEVYRFIVGEDYQLFQDDFSDFRDAVMTDPYNLKEAPFKMTSAQWDTILSAFLSRYSEYACVRTKTPELKSNDCLKFLVALWRKIFNTHEYYLTLLTAYNDSQTKLMNDIKAITKSKARFNDTPQLEGAETYETDDFATNINVSEGESSTELNTKMMRLKEIQDNYKRILEDWLNELHCVVYNVIIEEDED